MDNNTISTSGSINLTGRWNFCPTCGQRLDSTWHYCASCGRHIGDASVIGPWWPIFPAPYIHWTIPPTTVPYTITCTGGEN